MKNQTKPEWLSDYPNEQFGLGIFLIPDVTSQKFGAANKVRVEDITYQSCVRRGLLAIAFQWVPQPLAVECNLTGAESGCEPPRTGTASPKHRCVDWCAEPGYLCNEYTGECE